MVPGQVKRGATLSRDGLYRYTLRRAWGSGPFVAFVGLNPSTADATQDDPTIRRCIRFARDWGYDGLVMLNLFAYRATNPKTLTLMTAAGEDPVGRGNDEVLAAVCEQAALIVQAWGSFRLGVERARSEAVVYALGGESCVLGRTKNGHPRHPLYMPTSSRPVGGLFQTEARLPIDGPECRAIKQQRKEHR